MTVGAGERDDETYREVPFRARPSAALLTAMADQYGLVLEGPVTDLGGGHLNLHIPDPPGPGWVLRVYAPWVSTERVAFVQSLRQGLREAGVPLPAGRATRQGASLIQVEGRVAEVDQYVGGRRMDEHRQLEIGMAMLGRVHTALDGLAHLRGPEPAYPNHICANEALSGALRTQAVVGSWPEPSQAEAEICRSMVELAEALRPLEAELAPSLHHQHVHGDFWDNNVLFDSAGDITAVLDLDFSGWRPRTDDLALVHYYVTATPGRQRVDVDHLKGMRACVDAYDSTLDLHLSLEERAAVPLALARTVLFMTRNILALEDDASDYGAPALPAQRSMLAGMADELSWSLDLAERWEEIREVFT